MSDRAGLSTFFAYVEEAGTDPNGMIDMWLIIRLDTYGGFKFLLSH